LRCRSTNAVRRFGQLQGLQPRQAGHACCNAFHRAQHDSVRRRSAAIATSSRPGPLVGPALHLRPSPPLAQPLLDDARLLDLGRQQDALGDEGRLGVELLDEPFDHLAILGLPVPSSTKYSRPISLPPRMKNTWTQALSSSRAKAITSESIRSCETIFWPSTTLSIACS
jgi:hypothetical protein